jgi:hypothetical protein
MILRALPRNRICVTSQAVLEFRTAWNPGPSSGHVASGAGNRILWSNYPFAVQVDTADWGIRTIGLRRVELAAKFPACSLKG